MKIHIARLWLVLAVAVMPALAQTPAVSDSVGQTLTANSKAFAEALKKKDVDFLKRTLAEDFRAIWSDGHLHERGEFLELAQGGEVQEFRPYNFRVLPVNENAAIVGYDCIVIMPEGDDQVAPRYQHISDLWVKQGGEWRLKFQQATPLRSID